MLIFVFGPPLDTVEEGFRDWQKVEELDEPLKRLVIVMDDVTPPCLRRVVYADAVGEGDVGVDWG